MGSPWLATGPYFGKLTPGGARPFSIHMCDQPKIIKPAGVALGPKENHITKVMYIYIYIYTYKLKIVL